MKIDKKHPRYFSLTIREKLVRGVKTGITSRAGLIAHGRGEAFDYLLNEKTHNHALYAIKAAAAYLILAKHPVISVNGNTAALCGKEIVKIAKLIDCQIEVNLYHHSISRMKKIENYLKKWGGKNILTSGKSEKVKLLNIASSRAIVIREGIALADCVLVPLEDGDRCEALVEMGKKVIAIDLNPLSRTAKSATVTIVDNIVRCLPILISEIKILKKQTVAELIKIIKEYDNLKILKAASVIIGYDKRNQKNAK